MELPAANPRGGRETRLLLATIAVSIVVLVVLAQFRFPEEANRQTADPAPAPLERLAARAAYDELAAAMADLERRLTPRVVVMRTRADSGVDSYVVAPRMTRDRAILLLGPRESIVQAVGAETPSLAGRHDVRDLAVLTVPPLEDAAVTMPSAPPRPGPRYVAVVEGTPQGAVVRPVYVGRIDVLPDPRTSEPGLAMTALQHVLPRGAAIFSLAGVFFGLVGEASGSGASVIPADTLRTAAEAAQAMPGPGSVLGIDVQPLAGALGRLAGADRGVMVNHVHPGGPAATIVEEGDVITAVNGTPVTTPRGFERLATSRAPGANATISLVRRAKPIEVTVVARETQGASPADPADAGAVFRAVARVGSEVVTVQPASPAAGAGLEPGDIVVRLDAIDAPQPAALLRAYRELAGQGGLLLTVRRGLQHRVIALEKP